MGVEKCIKVPLKIQGPTGNKAIDANEFVDPQAKEAAIEMSA